MAKHTTSQDFLLVALAGLGCAHQRRWNSVEILPLVRDTLLTLLFAALNFILAHLMSFARLGRIRLADLELRLVGELLCLDRSKSCEGAPLTLLWDSAGKHSCSAQTRTCSIHIDFSGSAPLIVSFHVASFFDALLCLWFVFSFCDLLLLFRSGAAFHNVFRSLSPCHSSHLLTCLRLACLDRGTSRLHSQNSLSTLHTQWSWRSWACVQCYFSDHSREPLRSDRLIVHSWPPDLLPLADF